MHLDACYVQAFRNKDGYRQISNISRFEVWLFYYIVSIMGTFLYGAGGNEGNPLFGTIRDMGYFYLEPL